MKKTNILWIADYVLAEHKGGAQRTTDIMIKHGIDLGYDIEIHSGGSIPDSKGGWDMIIINNITKYDKEVIGGLTESGKVIRYEHDYWVANNYPELYKQVDRTIFLSPLHKKTTEDLVGYKIDNSDIIPSPINTKEFKPKGEKEKKTVLWAGNFCEEKGSATFIHYAKQNPNYKFYIAGWGVDIEKIQDQDNIEYLGELNKKQLIKEYQRCEYFYHRPNWKEAFGRGVLEAYFCGCNLLINGNIGAVSYDWDYSNYNLIQKKVQSQNKFWKVIQDEIQTSRNME